MTKQSYIAIIAVIIVLFGLYALISQHPAGLDDGSTPAANTPPPPPPTPKITADGINKGWQNLIDQADGPARGNPNAKYTVIEVGDFQCPQCGKAAPLVERIIAASHGNAKLYFFNFPLPMHPHARFAAAAALAAANQGKFWPMYDVLYSHQDELIPSEVEYYASTEIPGFNLSKFEGDVASPAIISRVQSQFQYVESLQIQSTPTLLVRPSAGGTPVWYIGMKDEPSSQGILHLASNPPWGH